jgi:hypothetical protein
MDETSLMWLALRERRGSVHNHSKFLKDSSARRKTFAAAMQQFEEQMTAAKVVTPATSPLNLYYGLAQAGMAIAAARTPRQWSFSSHGVELGDTQPDLPDICVRPKQIKDGKGAFQMVASATSSPGLTGPVSIGSLWASLPDLEEAPLPGTDHPVALVVSPDMRSPMTVGGGGLPNQTLYHEPPAVRIYIKGRMPDESGQESWVKDLRVDYPTARSWVADPGGWQAYQPGNMVAGSMRMWLQGQTEKPLTDDDIGAIFDTLAPQYRYRDDRYLRPSIEAGSGPPPSPLMTWWLLLYSFSMLARYQPRKWTDLLNLDKPGCATQLQYALEVARSAIPHLVLEALDGRPMLLSKPMSF